MPKVSIIIPVYNGEQYLDECLDSVINQTLADIEIICINDGSADGSLSILEEYAAKDKRMVILHQENSGAGAARNRGLKKASGEYIHFLDADDYMVLDAYAVMYNQAKSCNLDCLKAKAYSVDALTSSIATDFYYALSILRGHEFNTVTSFYKLPDKFTNMNVTPWGGIYKRQFLVENNIVFNTLRCVNDRSFYINVVIKAKLVMFLNHYIVYHRINNPDSLVGIRASNFDCHFKSYRMIKEQCAHLPDWLTSHILEKEIQDLFSWYMKLLKEGRLTENARGQTKQFLLTLDTAPFREKLQHCRWYGDYYKLMFNRPLPFNIGRSLKTIWFCLKTYGLRSRCKNAVERISIGLQKNLVGPFH